MTKIIRRRTVLAIGIAAGSLATPMLARRSEAQGTYPAGKTVRMVVPFAAGGTTDLLARIVAQILAESMASIFVIDNKTGAGGNVSAEIVARAPPDGMTLLLGTVGMAVTNQYLYKDLSYDSEGSFAPVALVGEVANVVAVHPSFPAKTLKEFVDYCKVQGPNNVTYSSPGIGSAGHLSMEYLQILAGIKLAHVVYRGRSAMMKALIAGHVPIAMDNLPPYLQHLQSRALSALAVTSSKRWFATPDVPTVAEQGYADFDAAPWWYVAAPSGTRLEVVKKLSHEIVKGIKSEPAIKKIRDAGASELPGDAEDLARHMVAENRKWKYVINAANIQRQ
jgi:tripartite-type tricarboxylate transporter receptor subunit TctC